MKKIHSIAAAVALCVVGITPALAQSSLQNGTFSAGLSGWDSFGDVSVYGGKKVAALTTASVDFDDDAPLPAGFYNRSGTAAVDFFSASDLAGVSYESLDTLGGDFSYEGSAISQSFGVQAGDTLTFDWAFMSADREKADFGFLAVNGNAMKFADARSTNGQYSYTFTTNGTVSLVLGVVDVSDASATSELRLDNISVTAVPEPTTYAMLLAGLALMGTIARRRSTQA